MNTYVLGSEDPTYQVTWTDSNGAVIDFSAVGWSFELKLGFPGRDAVLTKTSGIVGAATAPNITVTWAATDLDDLDPGTYVLQLTPTLAGRSRSPLTELFTLAAPIA
jgi:hypothetical protein